jgi:hypothetical protein
VVAVELSFAFDGVWLDALDECELSGFELADEQFRKSASSQTPSKAKLSSTATTFSNS